MANCQVWGHVSFVLDKAWGRYRYSFSRTKAGSMFMAHMLALIQFPPLAENLALNLNTSLAQTANVTASF